MNKQNPLHFCPDNGWFGDAMPLYENGMYHIYYTKAALNDNKCSWGHISSHDLIHFENHPDPLSYDEEDVTLLTGCVYKKEEIFYAFYPANNKEGQCRLLRARSTDGIHFQKERQELFCFNSEWYADRGTWRDPCIIRNEKEKCWWMVFCAKSIQNAPNTYPGSFGFAKSTDFENWTLQPPLWEDGFATAPECPDIFQFDGKWAMLYYWHETRIRFLNELSGNWERTKVISPDHFDFMAGKQMDTGSRHILAGWIPRKSCDCSERIWGGNLAILRELYMKDGLPATRFISELDDVFTHNVKSFQKSNILLSSGAWNFTENEISADAFSHSAFASLVECPSDFRFKSTVSMNGNNLVFHLIIRADEAVQNGYKIIFDRPGKMIRLRELYVWDQRIDLAVIPWYDADQDILKIDLVVHHDLLEICINEACTMVSRLMKFSGDKMAYYIQDGHITLKNSGMFYL